MVENWDENLYGLLKHINQKGNLFELKKGKQDS